MNRKFRTNQEVNTPNGRGIFQFYLKKGDEIMACVSHPAKWANEKHTLTVVRGIWKLVTYPLDEIREV